MKGAVFFLFPLKVTLNPPLSNRNDLEIPGYLPFHLFIPHCPKPPLHLKPEFTHSLATRGGNDGTNPTIELNYCTI